jgi:hypothetical protein
MSLICSQTFTNDEGSFDVSMYVFTSGILLQNSFLFLCKHVVASVYKDDLQSVQKQNVYVKVNCCAIYHTLEQRHPNYGPRATSGPPRLFMWPALL